MTYTLATPSRSNWQDAVQRAARLLQNDPRDTLVNTCQNVPRKYLPQLHKDAMQVLTNSASSAIINT